MINFDTALRCFDIIEVQVEDERVPFRLFHTAKVLREDTAFHLVRETLRAMPPGVLKRCHSQNLQLSADSGSEIDA